MDQHTQLAIAGAALAPLSREQKRDLVLAARRAYAKLQGQGQALPDFEEWRHQQQILTVERESLTTCHNEDYLFLLAHYQSLCGYKQAAERSIVRATVEPRIWAMNKFSEECEAAADVLPQARQYAAGFLRNSRGVELDDASAKQIWHAIYIIRRRAAQLRRKSA